MSIPLEQQEVAQFLTTLTGTPARETHISAIFIGSDTVWKLKKAIRMPFLDFTTRESRKHFLNRELELNQASAAGMYRDVIGIERRPDGTLALGNDHPIDFVLRMAPVPASDFIDAVAAEHRLTAPLLDAIGDAVAAFHAGLEPLAGQDAAASMLSITEGNERSALAAGLPAGEVRLWRERMRSAIEAHRPWLADRARSGFIRRCHGDLHLGNICLWNGKPTLFDALEFDESLATIDVSYDLAFLLMDLDRQVGRAAANRVMNRYVARTGDVAAAAGFPIFLSQRAMIRAHVLTAMRQDGRIYLSAALDYLTPVTPLAVAIGGLQGAGKSTLARGLAPSLGPAPGALIVRSDEIRKHLYGLSPEVRLPPEAYSPDANAATNQALIAHACAAIEAQHSVIVDATFLDTNIRERLENQIMRAGAAFLGFWLDAPLSLLESRVSARTADASDATVEVLRAAAASNPGTDRWVSVNAEDGDRALRAVERAVLNAGA